MNLEDANFPKINSARQTGRKGITILKDKIENELNWLFRETHLEDDFGIDGHLDIITDEGKVTGKSIAFQLKTGESFFKEKNDIGYIFRGDNKHLNYYINYSLPILIILVNPNSRKIIWELFDATKTDRAKNSWKITIPENKTLGKKSKESLLQCVGPITDFSSQLQEEWKINDLLKKHNRILFEIPKKDIIEKNFQPLLDGLERIQATTDLILHLKNRVDIFFDGYNYDKRELFEIPEVKEWVLELFKLSNCWPYLMALDDPGSFMKVALFCHLTKNKKIEIEKDKFSVDYDPDEVMYFMKLSWHKLNLYSDEKNISEKVNREISNKIMSYFTNGNIELGT